MKKLLFITILCNLFNQFAFASELKFVSAEFPPFTFTQNNKGTGAMYEVVQELARRLGQSTKIEFIPWARARIEAEGSDNIGIIPLARTPERENKYTWLIHVLDDPYVLVTKKDSKIDISNMDNAKKLTIGILAGSAAEPLLKGLGFLNINPATTDIQNVKKLSLGRIDAWASPSSCIGQYKEIAGLGAEDMRKGVVISILHEYIGASKTLDQETQKKWKDAFLKMKADGTYSKIMKKYNLEPLP